MSARGMQRSVALQGVRSLRVAAGNGHVLRCKASPGAQPDFGFAPCTRPFRPCNALVDMTALLADDVAAALGTRGEPPQRVGLVDVDRRDLELVDVRAFVVLGVGDR